MAGHEDDFNNSDGLDVERTEVRRLKILSSLLITRFLFITLDR